MIELSKAKLRYKNFLSVGKNFIEVDLAQYKRLLITGKNGHGKSTFGSALCFVLFGEIERKHTKSQIINNVNKSDCVVEIEFEKEGVQYKIVRGIKPNVFDIYENDVLLDKPANVKDYQQTLENILGINFDSWTKLVFISSTVFKPLFDLSAKERREFIEKLLDIEMISELWDKTKKEIRTNKEKLSLITNNIKHIETSLNQQKMMLQRQKDNNDQRINQIRDKLSHLETVKLPQCDLLKKQTIDSLNKKIDEISSTNSGTMDKIKILLDQYHENPFDKVSVENELNRVRSELSKLQGEVSYVINEGKRLKSELDDVKSKPNCPTCGKSIDDHASIIQSMEQKLLNAREEYQTKNKLLTAIKEEHDNLSKEQNLFLEEQKLKTKLENEINILKERHENEEKMREIKISDLRDEIRKENDKDYRSEVMIEYDMYKKQLSELENETYDMYLVPINETVDKLSTEDSLRMCIESDISYLTYMEKMFRDDGVKSVIIKKYIPFINQRVNDYLSKLGMFLQFSMDENFDEILRMNYASETTYHMLSEGQKQRVDLAIMFTFRDIAKIKESSLFDIFVLDDMTCKIDAEGIQSVLSLIEDDSSDILPIIINHDRDKYEEIFDGIVEFKMVDGFTKLV